MIKITIASPQLREVPYTDKKGQPQRLLIQTAYLHAVDQDGTVQSFPDKFEIVLPKGVSTPWASGDYNLHPSALSVRDGRLTCEPRLSPIRTPAKS